MTSFGRDAIVLVDSLAMRESYWATWAFTCCGRVEGRVSERLGDERRGECLLIHILGETGKVDRIPAVGTGRWGWNFRSRRG